MISELDCRGLGCPAPVLTTRDVLKKETPATISVLVDSESARQNVTRFLEHQNFNVTSEAQGADFKVVGTREAGQGSPVVAATVTTNVTRQSNMQKVMILVTSERMGHGDDGLGDMLQFNFLKTLKEMGPELWQLVFVNGGVNFTAEGSEAVPVLRELASQGVQIRACGACLAYFHLLDKIVVGEITNMLDIVIAMKLADTVVTI